MKGYEDKWIELYNSEDGREEIVCYLSDDDVILAGESWRIVIYEMSEESYEGLRKCDPIFSLICYFLTRIIINHRHDIFGTLPQKYPDYSELYPLMCSECDDLHEDFSADFENHKYTNGMFVKINCNKCTSGEITLLTHSYCTDCGRKQICYYILERKENSVNKCVVCGNIW